MTAWALLMLAPTYAFSQSVAHDVYGWLRYDEFDQDQYGICKFTTESAKQLNVVYPYDKAKVACAGAYAEGYYYVYLYETDGYNATPSSLNKIDLSTGVMTQVADYRGWSTLYQDMTYDPTTKQMFALGYDENQYCSMLLKVNLTDGEATVVGLMEAGKYIALACSQAGQLYAIDVDNGDLWTVNKETAVATSIGYTGERVYEDLQSMEFDFDTNQLYWAGYG